MLTKGTVSNLQIHNAKLYRPTFLIHTYKLANNLCGFTFSQMQSVGSVFANRLVGVVTATVWFSNCIQCSSLEILSKQQNHCEHSKGSKINYNSQFMCVTKTWHRLWITWIVCVCVCVCTRDAGWHQMNVYPLFYPFWCVSNICHLLVIFWHLHRIESPEIIIACQWMSTFQRNCHRIDYPFDAHRSEIYWILLERLFVCEWLTPSLRSYNERWKNNERLEKIH